MYNGKKIYTGILILLSAMFLAPTVGAEGVVPGVPSGVLLVLVLAAQGFLPWATATAQVLPAWGRGEAATVRAHACRNPRHTGWCLWSSDLW